MIRIKINVYKICFGILLYNGSFFVTIELIIKNTNIGNIINNNGLYLKAR